MKHAMVLAISISFAFLGTYPAAAQEAKAQPTQAGHTPIGLGEVQKLAAFHVSIADAGYKSLTLIDQGQAGGSGSMRAGGNTWNRTTEDKWVVTIRLDNRDNSPGNAIVPIRRIAMIDSAKKTYSVVDSDTMRALRGTSLGTATSQSTGWDTNGPAIVESWFNSKRAVVLRQSTASTYLLFELYGADGRIPYATIKTNSEGEWDVRLLDKSSLSLALVFSADKDARPSELQWPELQPFSLSKN